MNYRFSILAAVAMLCSLAMTTACTKDDADNFPEGSLEIFAEGSGSGTKTTVNGTSVKWVAGDKVRINGDEGTVTQGSGNHWYAAKDGGGSFVTSTEFNSFYPDIIATAEGAGNLTTTSATVVFPSRYASSFDGDNQVLSLPMAARSEANATGVKFKHLSAGINVNVKNTFTNDTVLYLDSVSVTSGSVNLCGQASVGLSTSDVPTVSATGTGSKTVTVYFSSPVALAVNAEKCVQVPVIPSSTDLGTVTIRVYTHLAPVTYGSMEVFSFEKNKSSFGALGRNEVKASPEIGIVRGGADVTPSVKGAFSVSPITRVSFSQGNLQQDGETWKFATNQYDNGGLFTWNSESRTIGGATWRMMTSTEWDYLLFGRSGPRFAKARLMDEHQGVILLPDHYVHPAGLAAIEGVNETGNVSWNANKYTAAEWARMEAAGAVFLPAAGYSGGASGAQGYYWSSSPYNNQAYRFYFSETELTASNAQDQTYGCSVRLVKEAN